MYRIILGFFDPIEPIVIDRKNRRDAYDYFNKHKSRYDYALLLHQSNTLERYIRNEEE